MPLCPLHPPPLPYNFPPHPQGQPPCPAWGCAALCPITKHLGPPPALEPLGSSPSLSTWAACRQDAGTGSVWVVAPVLGAQTSQGSLHCLLSLGGCSDSSAQQTGVHQGFKGPLSWLGLAPPLWGPSSWALRASPVPLGSVRSLHPLPAAGKTAPGCREPPGRRVRVVALGPARNRDIEVVNKELQ